MHGMEQSHHSKVSQVDYLASERAMDIRFLKTSVTGSAVVSRTLELPVLRSFLDEHHFGTIDCICLNKNQRLKLSKTVQ